MTRFLEKFYTPDQIYLTRATLDGATSTSFQIFNVPSETSTTGIALDYVTAENYVRVLSQASVQLAYLLVHHGNFPADLNSDQLTKEIAELNFYFHSTKVIYNQKQLKGHPFELEITLSRSKKINVGRANQQFFLSFKSEPISGIATMVLVQ